jgi:hypothetical protein
LTEHQQDRNQLESWVKIVSILIAVGTFLFGVVQYSTNQRQRQEDETKQARSEAVQRKLAAQRPYLEHQLELYIAASRSGATIASSDDEKAVRDARQRFWELYWGELSMVEDQEVESAMARFGEALSVGASRSQLEQCSLALSHALRESLARSWGVEAWKSRTGGECRPSEASAG